jgi:hypothetical protein
MKRKGSAPIFKAYVINRMALMPLRCDEKIPSEHLVRVVNKEAEKIDLRR